MVDQGELRVAWLVPEVELGAYWQPVLREFTKVFKNTVFIQVAFGRGSIRPCREHRQLSW
jgi:hypothetical protein